MAQLLLELPSSNSLSVLPASCSVLTASPPTPSEGGRRQRPRCALRRARTHPTVCPGDTGRRRGAAVGRPAGEGAGPGSSQGGSLAVVLGVAPPPFYRDGLLLSAKGESGTLQWSFLFIVWTATCVERACFLPKGLGGALPPLSPGWLPKGLSTPRPREQSPLAPGRSPSSHPCSGRRNSAFCTRFIYW